MKILNLWGSLASLAIIYCYFPQLKQTFTSKNVEGQNLQFWGFLTFSIGFFFINAIVQKAGWATILGQFFNLVGAAGMFIMVKKYK